MKHKVIYEDGLYFVMYKKSWYTRWQYVRNKTTGQISFWNKKNAAQSYINFIPKKK